MKNTYFAIRKEFVQMARKPHPRKGKSIKVQAAASAAKPQPPTTMEAPWYLASYMPLFCLFLLAFVLYGNTLSHGYALDDAIVITDNIYTQEGASGLGKIFSTDAFEGYFKQKKSLVAGGRYRPLSIATFALEIEFFGQNPAVSHFLNVVFYGLTGIVLFLLLQRLIPSEREKKWWASLSFLASALYLVHPLHTEVVANIKGRDEILAMLLVLSSLLLLFRWLDEQHRIFWLPLGAITFFLALLAKETALPFVLIFPLTVYFFRRPSAPLKSYGLTSLAILAPIGLYFVIRAQAVGSASTGTVTEILNDPFIHATYAERLATVSHTLGLYLGKLLLPITLSHDYYFNQIPIIGWGNAQAIVPLLLYLGLLGLTIWGTIRRHPAAWGMWFFFLSLSLVSNVVISVGTTMGERFLYVPSLGFLVAGVFLLRTLGRRLQQPRLPMLVIAVFSLFFVVRTILRNPAWKDNFTLFTTDVAYSPNSAKLRTAAGGTLVEAATASPLPPAVKQAEYLQAAIQHLNEAVRIYPAHGQAWLLLGNAYFNYNNQYGKALESFQTAIRNRPNLADAYKNAGVTANKLKRSDLAASYYTTATRLQPNNAEFWYELGITYEEWGKADSAIYAFEQTLALQPENADAMGKIAMVYGRFKQNYAQAIAYAQRALQIAPKNEGLYENMGIAYAMKGDVANALATFNQGLKVLPNSAKLHLNLAITYQNMGDATRANQAFETAFRLDPSLRR